MLTYVTHETIAMEARLRREDAANRRRAKALRATARKTAADALDRPAQVRFPAWTVRARYWLAA